MLKLTAKGIEEIKLYIRELKAKRKEIVDAKLDTIKKVSIPTIEDIFYDIEFDENGDYYGTWSVTDNYAGDYPLHLERNTDFISEEHNFDESQIKEVNAMMEHINELKTLKVFYNGIKVNGANVKTPITYMITADNNIRLEFLYERCRPAGFNFFELDKSKINLDIIAHEHPLYSFFYDAYIRATLKDKKLSHKHYLKMANDPYTGNPSLWREKADECQKIIGELEHEYPHLSKQLHPTSDDVFLYKEYLKEKIIEYYIEEKRIKDEQKASTAAAFNEKCCYRTLFEEGNIKYPIKGTDPYYVQITWSEHPALNNGEKMSLQAADEFLGYLDMKNHLNDNHYDKTKFIIMNNKNEPVYIGRYDLGDGDEYKGKYGLIAHIYNEGKYMVKHPAPGDTTKDGWQCMKFAKELWNIISNK